MKARTAARELSMLCLFQWEQEKRIHLPPSAEGPVHIEALFLAAVRALSTQAKDMIQSTASDLAQVAEAVAYIEADHPNNLNTPIEAPNRPVSFPDTKVFANQVNTMLQSADALFEALRIPELVALAHQDKVKTYAIQLIQTVHDELDAIDNVLNQAMTDWKVGRLAKMDRVILRLATAELQFIPTAGTIEPAVVIDEALELAKLFSSDESPKFIHGVLSSVTQDKTEQPNPSTLPSSPEALSSCSTG